MPNKETFKIKPIAELLQRYVKDGRNWVDPFAGNNSPAEYTNDLNPNTNAREHTNASDYVGWGHELYYGILIDPPYSPRQIKECYESIGIKPTMEDTNQKELNLVKGLTKDRIIPGGYSISFGWNSNGMGKERGFEIIEILLVAHGGHHNDTIVTVERKVQKNLIEIEPEKEGLK